MKRETLAELVDLALRCHKAGDLGRAERLYRQVLQADPLQPLVQTNLGIVLQATGRWREAQSCFENVIKSNPAQAEPFYFLGLSFSNLGRLTEASDCFRQALAINPDQADVHNQLGIALARQGLLAEAAAHFRETVRINADHAGGYTNLGSALANLGQPAEAVVHLRQALRLNPHASSAHVNLGNALVQNGQEADGAACFREAMRINPANADAHNNLGIYYCRQRSWADAASSFRQAVRLNPNHVAAHNNLGTVLAEQNKPAEAAECFRQALRIGGAEADAYYNLGKVLARQQELTEAAECYRQALRLNPGQADAHNGLGIVLFGQKQLDQAIACYRAALRLDPAHVDAHHNLGNALTDGGALDEAATCYREALRLDPNHEGARTNLGNVLWEQGQHAEAAACFERAIAGPTQNMPLTRWNRALLRLLQGDFAAGWPDYELRWVQPGKHPRLFKEPGWDGLPFAGKTILVHAEQGLGDTLQFVRYLPLVKKLGGTVIFECPPVLFELLARVAGADLVVTTGTICPPIDIQVPLLSLPLVFGTTLGTIPSTIPYLSPDPERVDYWRQYIERNGPESGRKGTFKVGIVWQGSMDQKNDRRSLSLDHFAALAKVDGVCLVSLQVGGGAEQVAQTTLPILDLGSRFDPRSFADAAAALTNLDIVVTVDTSMAHLAGALGLPVWVALPFSADWRWLLERTDSPWYPTMRLFRQGKNRSWNEVFERLAQELTDRLKA